MKVYEGQTFQGFTDRPSIWGGGKVFSDLEVRRCSFVGCAVSITRDPKRRSTVRNVKLIDCEQRGCAIDTAIIEDVLVDGLKTYGLLQTWGAAFKHVTLRGKIGEVMISKAVATGTAKPAEQRAFDEANAAFYATVDWALDISEGDFQDLELQGVPARLVRRDPTSQVIVTREKALQGAWQQLDLSETHWSTSIEFLLERGDSDVVLVAGKRDPEFKVLLDGLKKLRDAGVAEPD